MSDGRTYESSRDHAGMVRILAIVREGGRVGAPHILHASKMTRREIYRLIKHMADNGILLAESIGDGRPGAPRKMYKVGSVPLAQAKPAPSVEVAEKSGYVPLPMAFFKRQA